MTAGEIAVQDAPDQSRYVAMIDGKTAGFAQYERIDGLIAFVHTQVEDEFAGLGVGSALVQQSLDDVRSKELTVRPVCPFYEKFFAEHPEYADLLG